MIYNILVQPLMKKPANMMDITLESRNVDGECASHDVRELRKHTNEVCTNLLKLQISHILRLKRGFYRFFIR